MKVCPSCLHQNTDDANLCVMCGTLLGSCSETREIENPLHLRVSTNLKNGIYQIMEVLGEGGFGITYKGVEVSTGKLIAIKELLPERAARGRDNQIIWSPQNRGERNLILQRFREEAELISQFNHPSIVKVYDFFEENNTAYMVMEFVKGKTLANILKGMKQELNFEESIARKYLDRILEALSVIHSQGVLHRDIKPENIIIDTNDNPILIDFGSAREYSLGKTTSMTRLLTQNYAPPEQYLPKSRWGPYTDIYALCATFYELLTKETVPDSQCRVIEDKLVPPRQIRPDLSPCIERVLLKGLKLNPSHRFQSVDDLINELNRESNLLKLARKRAKEGKIKDSSSLYEDYLSQGSAELTAYVELSMVYCHIDDSKAFEIAKLAIDRIPNDGRAYGVLGLVLSRLGKKEEGILSLKKSVSMLPSELWVQINLSIALFFNNQIQECDANVNNLLTSYPNLIECIALKAMIDSHSHKWKNVIRLVRRCFYLISDNKLSRFQIIKQNLYPLLITAISNVTRPGSSDIAYCIQEYIKEFPEAKISWSYLGLYYTTLCLYDKAITSYLNAIGNENDYITLFNLAFCYYKRRDYKKCVSLLEDCIKIKIDDYYIYAFLGRALSKLGEWELARKYLEKSISLNTNFAQSYHNLGFVLINIFKLKKSDAQNNDNLRKQILKAYKRAKELYKINGQNDKSEQIQQYLDQAKICNNNISNYY